MAIYWIFSAFNLNFVQFYMQDVPPQNNFLPLHLLGCRPFPYFHLCMPAILAAQMTITSTESV